jgi:ATP-dependent RNA helicase RhlE
MTFEQLGLSQPVLQALALKDYTVPTPIQEQAIPTVLGGRDLLGIAQTGTGKTAAFMLPSIDRLARSDHGARKKTCRMLVLAPTRELAGQIAKSARDYGALSGLSVAVIVGGTSVGKDRQNMARGVDILVATPGRLVDLVDQRALMLDEVEILVLDEADQMLDLGFIHALRKIVALLPKRRQTLLFSATMPKAIQQLAAQYLTDPAQVSVAPAATTAERVDQFVCFVGQKEKQALLTLSLRKGLESREMDRVLVFTRTKHGADRVVRKLAQSNIRANAIHGNKSQPQREKALAEFREGKVRVLVATDIAARGIDIPGVSHVINFELPNVAEQYVHRIGRTARAGAAGVALAFCASDERDYLRDIQKLTRVTLQQVPLPEAIRAEVERIDRLPSVPADEPRVHSRGGGGHGRRPKAQVKPKPYGMQGGNGGGNRRRRPNRRAAG